MKITNVRVIDVPLGKLERPFWNSIVTTTSRGGALVRVETDEGIVGTAPARGGSRGMIEGAIRAKLLEEDPLRTGYLWDKMYMGGSRKPVAKGDYIVAMSAVDNALWDLKGKALAQPVWRLLGGTRTKVRAYAAGGYYAQDKGLGELAEELSTYVSQGYTAVKMKVGWPGAGLKEDAKRVEAARNAVGPDIDLMVDANNAWDASTAIRFARMIEEYDPYWFEEPVPADDLNGARRIVDAVDVPVASGENEYCRWGFRDLIDAGAVEIVQADPNTCGGISEWMRIAAYASAHHLPMAPHGNAAVGSACVAAVENGLITENYLTAFQDELFAPVDYRDGYIHLPGTAGLGIEWNEELIDARGK
ncbi:MAG: mandelate racemase/muconate lactonizing enzyme family protein [Spirochaetales bacterium]|nr:MAG: mandelate racemase/muconate lactonizing enzyme family protein [Spirochaetales bacterium]